MCFFVYVPATTEIYTYGHTLSLHDALPIGPRGGPGGPWRDRAGQARRPHSRAPGRRPAGGAHGLCGRRAGGLVTPRSEEHTSELQSLMRISYAVFCLKKNKTSNSYLWH